MPTPLWLILRLRSGHCRRSCSGGSRRSVRLSCKVAARCLSRLRQSTACLLLRNAACSVQVRACAIAQDLRQPSRGVKHIASLRNANSLANAVTDAVVRKRVIIRPLRQRLDAIRLVVRVRTRPIVEQVAVVVPSVRHSI